MSTAHIPLEQHLSYGFPFFFFSFVFVPPTAKSSPLIQSFHVSLIPSLPYITRGEGARWWLRHAVVDELPNGVCRDPKLERGKGHPWLAGLEREGPGSGSRLGGGVC